MRELVVCLHRAVVLSVVILSATVLRAGIGRSAAHTNTCGSVRGELVTLLLFNPLRHLRHGGIIRHELRTEQTPQPQLQIHQHRFRHERGPTKLREPILAANRADTNALLPNVGNQRLHRRFRQLEVIHRLGHVISVRRKSTV